jgi:MFS family permease
MEKLREEVKRRLAANESPARIRAALIEQGYAEQDINESLNEQAVSHVQERDAADKRNSRIFTLRELLDRVGYGAAAPQFINILFYQTGATLFLLGLFNGLRTVLSLLFTSVLQEYAKVHRVSKNFIGAAGVLFGFSFLFMAFAVRSQAVWLFAVGILLAGIGVVTYGDLYNKFVMETLRREKMGGLLRRMGTYGVFITMASMLLGGWLIDRFPATTPEVMLLGIRVTPIGYLLSFEITAFAFIISGYMLSFVVERREERSQPLGRFIVAHYASLTQHIRGFVKDRYITLLLLATVATGLLEVLGHSYYGLFIYQQFKDQAFGGFLNVAVIAAIAIFASFSGPFFTRLLQRAIGFAPMLVFGTLLMAILPLTLVYNANIGAVGAAFACAVIGGAIVGYSQGLLARKLMDEATRRTYFMAVGLLVSVPYLLLVPFGAWLAQAAGMTALFLVIGVGLAVVVMPLYFILVALANKQRL